MGLQRPQLIPEAPPSELLTQKKQPGWNVQLHPGYGLTARGLVVAYRQAEFGWPLWQCDTFDDIIESDGHLRSAIESRLDAVAGKPWIVLPGGDAKEDLTAAEELEGALRDVANTAETFGHMLKVNIYGYSAAEIAWNRTQGIIAPTWFANEPHRRFTFDLSMNPMYATADVPEGQPLIPGAWWFWGRSSSYNPTRAGLMRTAAWWSLFKRMAVRDWVVFAERFGLPYVLAQWGAGASPEDKAVAKKIAATIGTDGAGALSELVKVTFHTAEHGGKTSDVHGAIASLANAEMSKLITGATLTTETAGPGSFALGQVHADAAFELRAGDAEKLSAQFEQAIGAPFVKWNQMKARPPRLKINLVRDMAPLTRAQILSILCSNIGLSLDEEQLRQENQLRKPADGKGLTGAKPVPIGVNP